MKKLFKNKKGFTLVELMVVVAILGILVAVAIPVYNSVTTKAEINTCAANLRTIESAIMQAEVNNDTVTAGDLDASGKILITVHTQILHPCGLSIRRGVSPYSAIAPLGVPLAQRCPKRRILRETRHLTCTGTTA